MASLPPLAPFPQTSWRQHLSPEDWDSLVEAWTTLSGAYLRLPDDDFGRAAAASDESVAAFVSTFVSETAASPSASVSTALRRIVFQLAARLLALSQPPTLLEHWFLSDLASIYPKKCTAPLLSELFAKHGAAVKSTLASLKKLLIPHLDAGIQGDVRLVESRLSAANRLLHASPHACAFLAGSDFVDGLVACFRIMNPPLRKVLVATTYLCLVGLTEAQPPKWTMLSDQLFTLKSAADAHRLGLLNANDSLVAELVTATPLLRVLLRRAEVAGVATESVRKRITALEPFKKGAMIRPRRLVRRKVDKGKGRETRVDVQAEMHVHRMSQITQVQDLFPHLGAGFVSRCLDEYGLDVEQLVANVLGETLPPRLASADRSEPLCVLRGTRPSCRKPLTWSISSQEPPRPDLAPRSTPPLVPPRRNVFDDDDLDRLAADVSRVSFGKRPDKTADDVLADRSSAPGKAVILSALAAFDSDDDERDDTYDAADVGGTVDAANLEADAAADAAEEALFRAYRADPAPFARDAATRRGAPRARLRDDTGLIDEAIEGWAAMLARSPQQRRRLEAMYAFSSQQAQLGRRRERPGRRQGARPGTSRRPGGRPGHGGGAAQQGSAQGGAGKPQPQGRAGEEDGARGFAG